MAAPDHLKALRAFEAAARHQSFAAAAAELNVTPAAVGQLVRGLEDVLGVALFNRSIGGRTRLVATEAAEKALADIRTGFDRLALGVAQLRESAALGVLTVTASPAFAAKWLLPRIERFHSAWPDMDVRLDTNLKLQDFSAQGIDIGVRYGAGNWPGLVAERLMEEEVYPVCSPAFLAQHPLNEPGDIASQMLIHDLSVDPNTGFASWTDWFERASVAVSGSKRGLRINNSAAVLQAAVDGQGVALARSVLACDDVSSGRLIRLFPEVRLASSLAYFVVYRSECASLPRLLAFRNWLVEEAAPRSRGHQALKPRPKRRTQA